MPNASIAAAVFSAAALLAAAACVNTGEAPKAAAGSSAAPPARSSETADRTGPASPAASDICALMPASEVAEIAHLPIDRVVKKPDGCEWYANAAAQQQRGADNARDTFRKLSAQEPTSDKEAVKSVENIFNGLRGAAGPNQPVFVVSVQHGDIDQAEALLRGTVAVNGGQVDPIEGLGDRAFEGPMGAFFYARKGAALITFNGIGTREQTIALARRIVPRIQ